MIVNSADELFIFGTTGSADFPTTLSAYQTTFKGGPFFAPSGIGVGFPNGSDIFVSRLSTNGGNLLASTFVGGTDNDGLNTASSLKFNYADEVRGEIDIDKNNNIYIATCTQSSDFPITTGFQNTNKQIKKWGLKFHKLELGKPSFDYIIDDKSIFYKKNWINELKLILKII